MSNIFIRLTSFVFFLLKVQPTHPLLNYYVLPTPQHFAQREANHSRGFTKEYLDIGSSPGPSLIPHKR